MAGDRSEAGPEPVAAAAPRSWQEMRDWSAALLLSRTGQDVAAWNRRVGLAEDALRPGRRLPARVRLTDARGNPGRAELAWSVERAP